MGALTEIEIFSCMSDNLKLAIQHCEDLARLPLKGETYNKFRHELRLIEGACRQASAWREDTRWLPIGRMMAEVHQKAGGWLRGYKNEADVRIKFTHNQQHPLFKKLADNLRALHKAAEGMRTKATGRVGMILPTALAAPHRDTKPIHITVPHEIRTPGGLIMPGSAA